MEIEPSTDHGSVMPLGECAMVTMDGMTQIGLMVPPDRHMAGGRVPDLMLFVTACAIRGMKEPDFVREQIDWFEAQRKG